MRSIYEDPDTDGILLVDAQNAFNALNRAAALRNIQWIRPEISTILINIYRAPAELFAGGSVYFNQVREPPREIPWLWRCMAWLCCP